MTNVFIVDDHSVIRDGLRELLHREGFNVVGDSDHIDDIDNFENEILKLKVDVLILDIQLNKSSGFDFLVRRSDKTQSCSVVLFTMLSLPHQITKAFNLGALACISKNSHMSELTLAVKEAVHGRKYIGQSLHKQMTDPAFYKFNCKPAELLSAREFDVLCAVVRGKTSAQIANKLNLSSATVETYRSRLMLKLGIDNVPSLVRYAIQWGIIDVNETFVSKADHEKISSKR